jgi:hypothetical protein
MIFNICTYHVCKLLYYSIVHSLRLYIHGTDISVHVYAMWSGFQMLTPQMSRAEQAGREKKMNNSLCPALGEPSLSGDAASWLHWKGKVTVLRLSAYHSISCMPRPGTRPGRLGEIQAVTTHRLNSSSWVGGRALIVKVMVGGGRGGISTQAELGPGEMKTGVNEGVGSGRAAEMQRDEGWNQCREPRVTCNRGALTTESSDVKRGRRKVRRAAEMQRDERWN